ncbi:MAG: type II toxin-antitoxin system VapC family toxin [Holophagaceae bacterium]|nr:type II toxin-antitoxin system VapC family toxin [Holophagaceae bacterium]
MNYLLDTNASLWLITNNTRLSAKAKQATTDTSNKIFLSLALIWEVAIKISIAKLNAPIVSINSFIKSLRATSIELTNILPRHCELVETLPFHHKDPFDRIIVATAIADNLTLITNDPEIHKYEVAKLW